MKNKVLFVIQQIIVIIVSVFLIVFIKSCMAEYEPERPIYRGFQKDFVKVVGEDGTTPSSPNEEN